MANTVEASEPQSGAAEAATSAKDNAMQVAGAAGAEARAVAHDATAHAREVVGETKEQLRRQASEQTQRLSTSLRSVSDQLRSMIEGPGAQPGMVVDLTRQLSDVTNGTADRLDGGGLEGVLDDVKRFARNRPAVFMMAAAGTGFVVGRMLKAVDTGSVVQAAKDSMADEDASDEAASFAPTSSAPTDALNGAER